MVSWTIQAEALRKALCEKKMFVPRCMLGCDISMSRLVI
jgi:hypothetical protein